MEDSRMPKRVMKEKICAKRRRDRPTVRWLHDVQEDLRATGIEGCRDNAQDRDLWMRKAQEAKAHEGLYSQVVVETLVVFLPAVSRTALGPIQPYNQ